MTTHSYYCLKHSTFVVLDKRGFTTWNFVRDKTLPLDKPALELLVHIASGHIDSSSWNDPTSILQSFVDYQIVKRSTVSEKRFDTPPPCPHDSKTDLPAQQLQPREMVFEPNANGFATWCFRHQKLAQFSLEDIFLLDQLRTKQLDSFSPQQTSTIQQLYNCGFLRNESTSQSLLTEQNLESDKVRLLLNSFPDPLRSIEREKYANNTIPIYPIVTETSHPPLALGLIIAYAKSYQNRKLCNSYRFLPIAPIAPTFLTAAIQEYGPGIFLFSSYEWSLTQNLQLSSLLKKLSPSSLMIHGGPSVPKYAEAGEAFLRAYPQVDIAVREEGEQTVSELLDCVAKTWPRIQKSNLREIDGISFLDEDQVVHTPDRKRSQDPNDFPSPYLTHLFRYYNGSNVRGAVLETNRGCPYGCTFCDWGSALLQKIRNFDLDRVKNEIEWIAQKEIGALYIADSNFGVFDRDVEIAEFIAETKKRYGFPKQIVVSYAKNTKSRLTKIVKTFVDAGLCAQGILSIQTADPSTLKIIRRANIKTETYDNLLEVFRGLELPMFAEIMLCLPGSTVESYKRDLEHYFERDIPIVAIPTKLLPNSPMADPEYVKTYQIKTDSNGWIASTSTFTKEEGDEMVNHGRTHYVLDSVGVARILLRYLQYEYNINAIDLMHRLSAQVFSNTEQWPNIRFVIATLFHYFLPPIHWKRFYDEFESFIVNEYPFVQTDELRLVISIQANLMPYPNRNFPVEMTLTHDFVQYYRDHSWSERQKQIFEKKSLKSYPPGKLVIDDPFDICGNAYGKVGNQYSSYARHWELSSPLQRSKVVPHFAQ